MLVGGQQISEKTWWAQFMGSDPQKKDELNFTTFLEIAAKDWEGFVT